MIIRVFQGVGEFDPHTLGVRNLNCALEFHVNSLAWRAMMGDAVLADFAGKDCALIVPLWPIGYKESKGLKQASCRF